MGNILIIAQKIPELLPLGSNPGIFCYKLMHRDTFYFGNITHITIECHADFNNDHAANAFSFSHSANCRGMNLRHLC